jgi:hypothetical protein
MPRHALVREHVRHVQDACGREQHHRVAVGVRGSEVVELDAIRAGADRHLVLERLLRQVVTLVLREDVRRRASRRRRDKRRRAHRCHVRLRVFLRDDVHGRGELDVAAHVIAMRVGVDDHRHRFRGERLDLVEKRLAPAGILGVHHRDAVRGDEDGGVAAGAGRQRVEHVKVVTQLLDLDGVGRRLRRLLKRRHGERKAPKTSRPPSTNRLFISPSVETANDTVFAR